MIQMRISIHTQLRFTHEPEYTALTPVHRDVSHTLRERTAVSRSDARLLNGSRSDAIKNSVVPPADAGRYVHTGSSCMQKGSCANSGGGAAVEAPQSATI